MTTKISQPTVETITAELFVIKIANKQMTVSVYNQLYIEDCWDKEWNILYPVWGKTNREGEYVIFQKGNDLRKCQIPSMWGKLDYSDELVRYIKGNSSEISKTIPNTRSNPNEKYWLLNQIMYLHVPIHSLGKIKFEEAVSVLDEKFLNEFKAEFKRRSWLYEKHDKMTNELKNYRQLFIAV